MKIVKNNTIVDLIPDEKYDLKRDGGFNTLLVSFYSTNPNILEIWDRVEIDQVLWRVAEIPRVKIDYEISPAWLYTINLIEPTAILQGVQMPNIAFTQPLAQNLTLKNAIEIILTKQDVYKVGQTQKYTLSSNAYSKLTAIAPEEIFEDKSLYDILKYYGEIIDAKPILNNDNSIDFEYFNDYTGTTTPTFTSIEISRTIENYATDIIEDAENVDTNEITYYPHSNVKVFIIPLDLTANMTFNNARIILPDKIKKIHRVSILELDTWLYHLEYGSRVFEKGEWDVLAQNTFWSFIPNPFRKSLRENSLFYEYGKNEIFNLQALQKNLVNIDAAAHHLRLTIEYEALEDIQISRSTKKLLDGGIKYVEKVNQNATTINFKAEGERLKYDLLNRQSIFYNVIWKQNTFPNIKNRINILSVQALITQMIIQKDGNEYVITARLSTEYNNKNKLTKVIRENPLFEIQSTQIANRKVVFTENAKIIIGVSQILESTGKWINYMYRLLFNINGTYFDSYDGCKIGIIMPFIQWKYTTPFLDDDSNLITHIALGIPNNLTLDNDMIINQIKMSSNTSVDFQRHIDNSVPVNYTAMGAVVTDENGENETIEIKYIPVSSDETIYIDGANNIPFFVTYPFVTQDFYQKGYGTLVNTNQCVFFKTDELKINKDRREKIIIEHQIILSAYGATMLINNDNLLKYSKFKIANVNNVDLKTTINNIGYYAERVVTHYNTYERIDFTYPASGTLSKISIYVGSDLLVEKIITKEVTETADFITIAIGN